MDRTTTPIEDRADWEIHSSSRKKSAALGLCFDCQQRTAFNAVEEAHGTPALFPVVLCPRCKPNAPAKPATPQIASLR
jgi:hypothetical protein